MSVQTAFGPADPPTTPHPSSSKFLPLGEIHTIAQGESLQLDSAGTFSICTCTTTNPVAIPSQPRGRRHKLTIMGPAEIYLDEQQYTVFVR